MAWLFCFSEKKLLYYSKRKIILVVRKNNEKAYRYGDSYVQYILSRTAKR